MSKPVWYVVDPRFPDQFGCRVVCRGPAWDGGTWVDPVTDSHPYFNYSRVPMRDSCLATEAEYELVKNTKGL